MTLLFSCEELGGRGKKGWKNEVGVGRMGKSGGELTSLLSSSSSISSFTTIKACYFYLMLRKKILIKDPKSKQ